LAKKKNLRLLRGRPLAAPDRALAYQSIRGGLLVQDMDARDTPREQMIVCHQGPATGDDWKGLLFAWKVCKWVKSNAIVYTDARRTLGIGAGQMSRIDAANLGCKKPAGGRWEGSCLRCLLPVPRCGGPGGAGGREGDHTARRLVARRGKHLGRRRVWHGHGLYRDAPLPALECFQEILSCSCSCSCS